MSFCNRTILPRKVLTVVAVLALAFLVACGSSSSPVTPPPTGAFSNSNLDGTYVFSTLGTDANGSPITIVGAFTACGCTQGTISTGNLSYFDPDVTSPLSGLAISGGSYSVAADGRGQASLSVATVNSLTLDFVLNSTSGGTVTEFDSNGTGSGTIDQQPSPVAASDLTGGYAYSLSGQNASGLYAQAGAFTLSAGVLTTPGGVYDLTNLNTTTGVATSAAGVALSATTVTVGTGTAPGTATITDANSNSYQFDVYPVSSSHLKIIETDGTNLSSGDVFTQATSLPSGTLAFTMGGVDSSVDPLSMGGLLPVSGGAISGGLQDYNDGAVDLGGGSGNTNSSVGGSFSALSGVGRATLSLSAFYNGSTLGNGTYTFAAYPTSNGTLLLEIDGGGITAGSALTQTNTSFASAQGYGLDLSAVNISGGSGSFFEEDDIAEFTSTSTGFTGHVDVNDEGDFRAGQNFNGTYSSISTGRYSFAANSDGDNASDFAGISGVFYTVDGSTILFLEGDTFQVGTGMLQVQNASGADSKTALSRIAMAIPKLAAKNAAKRRYKTK